MIAKRGATALLVVGMTMLMVGSVAPSAEATTPSGTISNVQVQPGHVKLLFVAHDLPSDVGLLNGKVSVWLDDSIVSAAVTTADESRVTRSIVLVIDTSGSMAGSGIASAKAAADSLLQALPPDVQVGVVSFADQVRVASPLTNDRQAARKAINALQTGGETALYDGVLAGLATIGATGQRRIVVLSDGGDTRSKSTRKDAVEKAKAAQVAIDAIGFRTQETQQSTLNILTTATGGVLYAANDADGVAAAFSAVAHSFVTQVYIDATVPPSFAGRSATLKVTAQTAAGTISATSSVELARIAAPSASTSSLPPAAAGSSPTIARPHSYAALRDVGVVALFLAFSLLTFLAFEKRTDRHRRRFADLLAGYAPAGREVQKPAAGESRQTRGAQVALAATDRLVKAHSWGERLARRLDAAGLTVRANEWLVLQIAAVVALTVVFVVLGSNIFVAAIICIIATELVSRLWVGHRAERRRSAFLAQLPDALQVLAGSLSTGYSLDQAVDSLVGDSEEPLAGEFGRAVSEARLGVPLDTALVHSSDRLKIEEFDWAVMAIQVQRSVGGSLAEVLRNVAATIRQREKLRRQVRVLSAEGRISGYILVALPLVMATFFLLFNPSYLRPLYHSLGGILALIVGTALLVVGWVWMRKIAKVEA